MFEGENCPKSITLCFNVGNMILSKSKANKQILIILKSSNHGSKVAEKCNIHTDCGRKPKLDSNDSNIQEISKER